MKTIIGVIALGLLVTACADYPAAEIGSMSDSEISVVYYDSISGMGDATRIAQEHCDPHAAEVTGKTGDVNLPNKTTVSFRCK